MKEKTPRGDQAELLSRTFALDVFACARCGGRRKELADVTAPAGVRSIVEHLGLATQALKRAPARGPPQQAWC
ncbi:ATP-dependent helicase HrpA [Cystobacter fuscus]|nr:ATP-dependent helicase HrpA [Cystobacter fuscus]